MTWFNAEFRLEQRETRADGERLVSLAKHLPLKRAALTAQACSARLNIAQVLHCLDYDIITTMSLTTVKAGCIGVLYTGSFPIPD
jgi:hypothetical protein